MTKSETEIDVFNIYKQV